jgi:hypothetical protein
LQSALRVTGCRDDSLRAESRLSCAASDQIRQSPPPSSFWTPPLDRVVRLVSFVEGGFPQPNRVTHAKSCRYDYSIGKGSRRYARLFFAGCLESFAHRRNHFRFECPKLED